MGDEERLYKACEDGDIDTVKKIIAKGTDPRTVKKIIAKGTDPRRVHYKPEWANGWDETPLHAACRGGHLTVAQYLIDECSADIHDKDGCGDTLLHDACRNGHLTVVQYLKEDCGAEVNSKNDFGNTPLHYACLRGHLTVVQYLVEKCRADVYSENSNEDTPLHCACSRGHLTVVQYLVEKCRADVNAENNNKWTPLHCACQNWRESVIEYLVGLPDIKLSYRGRSDDTTILDLAYGKKWLKVMTILITEQGVNTLSDGTSPLHRACQEDRESVVECLVGIPDVKLTYDRRSDGTTILDLAYWKKWWKVMTILITERGVNTLPDGTSPLHRACRNGDMEGVSHLLDIGVDPNQPTPEGSTALDSARSSEVIRFLLKKGAIPSYSNMDKCFPEHLQKDPADMAVKMFAVGNPDAGKSTLVKSIEKEAAGFGSRLVNQLTKVKGVDDKTAGIIPHEIHSKSLGRVILYDFAGHREFYAGHDALLRSSVGNSPSVVLVVVDISNEESQVRETVEYWLGFLAQQNYNGISKPNLLMIGSHADKISSGAVASKLSVMKSALSDRDLDQFECADPVMLDCRYAERSSMSALRRSLAQICQKSRATEKIDFAIHSYLVFLLDHFRNIPAITVTSAEQAFKEAVDRELHWRFMKSHDVLSSCKELNKQGSILLMSNHEHPEKSWIVLDKAVLLSQVNGKLFAPDDFKEHQKIANSTGVVPLSKLATVFPDLDQEMITQFLCHLEFCHEVTDLSVLGLLQSEDTQYSENERFFFFPSLVKHATPVDLWKDSSDFDYYTGWVLQCLKGEQFLTPRLLQVLLIRLAFQFALVASNVPTASLAIQRKCSVWKNGISWVNRSGGEAIVEVIDQKKIIVMTRCEKRVKQPKMESVQLRSAIMQTVLSTKKEFCAKVEMNESVIDPKDAVEYPINASQAEHISMKEVACTIKEGKELVVLDDRKKFHLEKLLHFEPYGNMNELLLKEIFEDTSKHQQEISADFIYRIAKRANANTDDFIAIIEPSLSQPASSNASPDSENVSQLVQVLHAWKKEMGANGTCCHLHSLLDQYSIFAGRNPLKVAKGEISPSKEHCVMSTESTASGESAINGATSNDVIDSPTSPLQQKDKEVRSPLTEHQDDFSPDQDTNGPVASTAALSESLLTEDDLGSVQNAVWEGRAQYHNLGLELGLTEGTLNAIEQSNHYKTNECFRAVLHEWLKSLELRPTWSNLARCLRAAPVGLGELADQIPPRNQCNKQ